MDFIAYPLGFILDYLGAGKEVGEPGVIPSCRFRLGKYKFHLHHWLGLAALIPILVMLGHRNIATHSFLLGMITRGMLHEDAFRIIFI